MRTESRDAAVRPNAVRLRTLRHPNLLTSTAAPSSSSCPSGSTIGRLSALRLTAEAAKIDRMGTLASIRARHTAFCGRDDCFGGIDNDEEEEEEETERGACARKQVY